MPRFFFDTHGGEAPRRDREGIVLPCLDTAKDEAVGLLRDLSHGAPLDGASTYSCDIRQDAGGSVYRLTLVVEGIAV